jgi:Mn2+/Fe2+ NRAMP family transporter
VGVGFLKRVLKGYVGLFKAVGFLAALIAASAVLGFLAAWPLWMFATTNRVAYSIFSAAVLAAGVVFLVVRAALRGRSTARPAHGERRRRPLVTALVIAAWIVLFAAGLYAILLFLSRGSYLIVIPVAVILLVLLGYLAFAASGHPKRTKSDPKKHEG